MGNLTPTDIAGEVRRVLLEAKRRPDGPCFLMAHQILERLPEATRERLIAERGVGLGGGESYSAATAVSKAAEALGAEGAWLDPGGISVQVGGETLNPGGTHVKLYRLAE